MMKKLKTPTMRLLTNLHFVVLILGCDYVSLHAQSQRDSCTTSNLQTLNSQTLFDTSSLTCSAIWPSEGFILRYSQAGPSLWSFVLSTPNTNSYVGIGFSPNGGMVGSNAIVGWLGGDGSATMKRYFLGGKSASQVVADEGGLQILNNTSSITLVASQMFLAFQLITIQPSQQLVCAVGATNSPSPSPPNFRLTQHTNHFTYTIDYTSGQGTAIEAPYSDLKRAHGILNILGWGVLIPIGAIVARYFKHLDSSWFYFHIIIQSLGFILGLSGVISGLILNDRIDINVIRHKVLGMVILTLGILQVIVVLIRPSKESKMRKYWNWYHHNVGRVIIILAIANIFYGIYLAKAGSEWNGGYGVILGIIVTIALTFELRMLLKD